MLCLLDRSKLRACGEQNSFFLCTAFAALAGSRLRSWLAACGPGRPGACVARRASVHARVAAGIAAGIYNDLDGMAE